MGYLFANMEKMDIQEERRKTAEARAELKAAKEKLKEKEAKAEEAEAKLKETEAKAEAWAREAVQAASQAEEKARAEAIKNAILLCRKFGASKETAAQELMELYGMDLTSAQEKAALYWESV